MENYKKQISEMNYPDFVAFLGQQNTPPGALSTVKYWVEQGQISPESHLLDLACSTGYSSRKCFELAGSSAWGIDISKPAIEKANEEASGVGGASKLKYFVQDASKLELGSEKFSHILGGCNFAFIQDRRKAVEECFRVLKPGGRLCVSDFYYVETPPLEILDAVQSKIGFRPAQDWSKSFWNDLYSSKFKLVKYHDQKLGVETEERLEERVRASIFEQNEHLKGQSESVLQASFERLLDIRRTLNQHRKWQAVGIAVWEKQDE